MNSRVSLELVVHSFVINLSRCKWEQRELSQTKEAQQSRPPPQRLVATDKSFLIFVGLLRKSILLFFAFGAISTVD